MPFVIEAVVQPAKHSPWMKVALISQNNDVQRHLDIFQKEYYDVASVKSRPADEVLLSELRYDAQGNTNVINDALVLINGGLDNDVSENSPTE